MKIKDWLEVQTLVHRLQNIEADIAHANGPGLGVTIQGRYQDDAMLSAVRRHVIAELDTRRAALVGQLSKLGVSID